MRACLLAGILVLGAGAHAAQRDGRATTLVKEANRRYLEGDYRKAAALLLRAEALEPNPKLLYNIARAFDQAGESARALDYYQRYLATPEGADPVLLKRSELAQDRLQSVLAQEARLKAEEQHRARLLKTEESPEVTRLRELQAARERAARESAERSGQNGRLVSYTLAAGAGVGLISGVAFGISAARAKGQFTQASNAQSKRTWQAAASLRAGIADASFAVALAAGVTAFIFYPDKRHLPFFSVGPLLAPDVQGGWAQVRF